MAWEVGVVQDQGLGLVPVQDLEVQVQALHLVQPHLPARLAAGPVQVLKLVHLQGPMLGLEPALVQVLKLVHLLVPQLALELGQDEAVREATPTKHSFLKNAKVQSNKKETNYHLVACA